MQLFKRLIDYKTWVVLMTCLKTSSGSYSAQRSDKNMMLNLIGTFSRRDTQTLFTLPLLDCYARLA